MQTRVVLLACLFVVALAQFDEPPPEEFCSQYGGVIYPPPMPPTPEDDSWERTPWNYRDWEILEIEGWVEAPISYAQVVCNMFRYNEWTASVVGPVFALTPSRARVHVPYSFDNMITNTECMFNDEGGIASVARWDELSGFLDIKWEFTVRDMDWGITYIAYRAVIPPWTMDALEQWWSMFVGDCDDECIIPMLEEGMETELGRIKFLMEMAVRDAEMCEASPSPPPF